MLFDAVGRMYVLLVVGLRSPLSWWLSAGDHLGLLSWLSSL